MGPSSVVVLSLHHTSFSAFDLGELAEYIYEQDYISSKELVKIPCVY